MKILLECLRNDRRRYILIENPISKGAYRILYELTKETRVETALHLALKQLIAFKKEQAIISNISFEKKYRLTFSQFEEAWV